MVLLKSSDDQQFIVEKEVIERSMLVRNMLEDVGEYDDSAIPLPNVTGTVLEKVIEYCEHHRGEPLSDSESLITEEARARPSEISEWDRKFMDVDQEMLFDLILAGNYLDIKELLYLGCLTVANMIKGKSPEEIRKLFGIVDDFTAEEKEEIRKENEYAEER